jgi:2-oxoglutarate ferredoxin oxidoreductase subunit beta
MTEYSKYLRLDKFPLIWCAGCGDGIVLKAILRAVDRIGLDRNQVCMVSGIGCSSRTPGSVDFNTLHTTHGVADLRHRRQMTPSRSPSSSSPATAMRPPSAATTIHAARRNIDLSVILYNN